MTAPRSVVAAIDYIRRNDCDFLTVETLQTYTGCEPEEARDGLLEVMGRDWLDGQDVAKQD